MTRVAIFDRDGTIIDVVRDEDSGVVTVAFHPDQIKLLPGAIDGMRTLGAAGYVLAIATNQPAPAKGQFSAEAVRRTNAALVARLAEAGVAIAAVESCMHHPTGGAGGDASLVRSCDCRKPKGGMLDAIVARFGAERSRSWMLGDSAGDVEAARAARVKAGLVFATNRCELCPLRGGHAGLGADAHGATLADLAETIVARVD